MRKLTLQMQTSLDGRFAAYEDVNWQLWGWVGSCPWDNALKADFNAIFREIDCVLISRKMAEQGYIAHWRGVAEERPNDAAYAFARRIGEVEKVVATKTLTGSRWERATVANGEAAETIGALKRQPGGEIIAFGGLGLAASLIDADLVDELQLFVNPSVVGDGASIFDGARPRAATLLGCRAYACGMVVHRYALN